MGCGTIIYTIGDRAKNVTPQVVHVDGDPDHPTNRGTLCPKGASLEQDILNDRRLLKPQVRRPGGTDWEDISWDEALDRVAQAFNTTASLHGSEAVWPYYYAGTMGLVQRDGINRLRHVMRYSRMAKTICTSICEAGWLALAAS